MPSNKPQILVRADYEIKEKLQFIANKKKRSLSNMAEIVIEEYINDYEKKNGIIPVAEPKEIKVAKLDDKNLFA